MRVRAAGPTQSGRRRVLDVARYHHQCEKGVPEPLQDQKSGGRFIIPDCDMVVGMLNELPGVEKRDISCAGRECANWLLGERTNCWWNGEVGLNRGSIMSELLNRGLTETEGVESRPGGGRGVGVRVEERRRMVHERRGVHAHVARFIIIGLLNPPRILQGVGPGPTRRTQPGCRGCGQR